MSLVLENEPVARGNDDPFSQALAALASFLRAQGYHFTTPTPATHARVLDRNKGALAEDIRGIFGWSMNFSEGLVDSALLDHLLRAGLVEAEGGHFRSKVRAASLGEHLFFHSAYPTQDKDAVFFGPDSFRFARLIEQELTRCSEPAGRLVDIGTGAGVGAIVATHLCPALEIMMTDINPSALQFAEANARIAGVSASTFLTEQLSAVPGEFDLVLANPPYIIDDGERAYRDGGGMHGGEVSLKMAQEAVPRLAPGGRFILYTGSAIIGGDDPLHASLIQLAAEAGCTLRYAEIDPDVFGEELERPAYRDVERIAVVSAVIERQGSGA